MKGEVRDYIEDIIEAMSNAMEFTKNMSHDEFAKDIKTTYAVIRAIEIAGEAVKNVPDEIRREYPDIPYEGIGLNKAYPAPFGRWLSDRTYNRVDGLMTTGYGVFLVRS